MPNLEIDRQLAAQLQKYVVSGEYADPSSVLRDGLRWIKPGEDSAKPDPSIEEAHADYDVESESDDEARVTRTSPVDLDWDVVERIEALLGEQTDNPGFADASDVVSRALFLLEDRKKLVHLRKLIAEAEDDFANGRFRQWKPGMMQELLELGRQRMRDGIPPSPDVQ